MNHRRVACLALMCVLGLGSDVLAQPAQNAPSDGWNVNVYPILGWLPIDILIDVDSADDGGGNGGASGQIIESRFDGAFFGGVNASNGPWRIEAYGIWAAFGGDRPELPFLDVDLDVIYGDVRVGRRVAPDFYVTGGVRRVALKYDIAVGTRPRFSGKPGLWDPLVGVGWHRVGPTLEWHASFEGGGFGVGADVDLGAGFRVDWKFLRHFGIAAGYNLLHLKVTDSVASRNVVVEPTVHGPVLGIGLYF